MKIVPAATLQDWENRSLAAATAPLSLMEAAVTGCFEFVLSRFPKPGRALFLCGSGHNGNDGLWLAARLKEAGWNIDVLLSETPENRKQVNVDQVRAMTSQTTIWPSQDFKWLTGPEPALIFDCLLGTGVHGATRGKIREILQWWDSQSKIWHVTISLDCPSGLNPDDGTVSGDVFRSDFTLAIGAVKQGCLLNQGPDISGRIIPVPIPISEVNAESLPDFFDLPGARKIARGLNPLAHKYQRGTVAVFAGSPGFAGAAVLASRAALRAGAGVVRLFCHPDSYNHLALATPEIMVSTWDNPGMTEVAAKAAACVIGPGFGTSKEARTRLELLMESALSPMVIDADALTCLAEEPRLLHRTRAPLVLTPHEGEFARLTGQKITDRKNSHTQWINLHRQHILLLKGPHSIVGCHGRTPSFNSSGHPGMATAGSGDVLAGIIGSLLAQKYDPFDSARLGAFWHGLAAEVALEAETEQTLLAGAILDHLGPAWRRIRPLN